MTIYNFQTSCLGYLLLWISSLDNQSSIYVVFTSFNSQKVVLFLNFEGYITIALYVHDFPCLRMSVPRGPTCLFWAVWQLINNSHTSIYCLLCCKHSCFNHHFVVVQLPSRAQLFATPWTVPHQTSLSLTISWSLPKFVSIALVMASSHLILWSSLLLLPSIFPSIRVFSIKSVLHIRWSKYWNLS